VIYRNFVNLSFLLAAIGLTSWLIIATNQPQYSIKPTSSNQIDTLVENVIATTFDKSGKPVLTVTTPKMTHYTTEDITEMTTPAVSISKDPQHIWNINSKSAQIIGNVIKIVFHGDVVVKHLGDEEHPVTTLYTSSLTVLPKEQLAETSEAILIAQPAAKIYGVGMHANLEEGTIQLLSNAREEYVPYS
jgi:lipopolysaccharide export system protein LptC